MLKGNSFRFGVETDTGERSSLWQATCRKSDFYFGTRSIMGVIKVSLHESGKGRVALTQEHQEKLVSSGRDIKADRKLNGWDMPKVPDNGAIHVASIVFPTAFLRKDGISWEEDTMKQKFIITCPQNQQAVEFGFFFSKEHPTSLEGKFEGKADPLVWFGLDNGSFVSVVGCYTALDAEADRNDFINKVGRGGKFVDLGEDAIKVAQRYDNMSAFLWNNPSEAEEKGVLKILEIHGFSFTKNK